MIRTHRWIEFLVEDPRRAADLFARLDETVRHWQKDIVEPMEQGRKARRMVLWPEWISTDGLFLFPDGRVRCTSHECPLCQEYEECIGCPYAIYYRTPCDKGTGHWLAFAKDPCLRTAYAMVGAIMAIRHDVLAEINDRLREVQRER